MGLRAATARGVAGSDRQPTRNQGQRSCQWRWTDLCREGQSTRGCPAAWWAMQDVSRNVEIATRNCRSDRQSAELVNTRPGDQQKERSSAAEEAQAAVAMEERKGKVGGASSTMYDRAMNPTAGSCGRERQKLFQPGAAMRRLTALGLASLRTDGLLVPMMRRGLRLLFLRISSYSTGTDLCAVTVLMKLSPPLPRSCTHLPAIWGGSAGATSASCEVQKLVRIADGKGVGLFAA